VFFGLSVLHERFDLWRVHACLQQSWEFVCFESLRFGHVFEHADGRVLIVSGDVHDVFDGDGFGADIGLHGVCGGVCSFGFELWGFELFGRDVCEHEPVFELFGRYGGLRDVHRGCQLHRVFAGLQFIRRAVFL
jgi:hypothetical protein